MCRLSARMAEIMDALVELQIFGSKSKEIATFLQQVMAEREEMFEEILAQAKEIASKKEAAKHLAFQAVMSIGKKSKKG